MDPKLVTGKRGKLPMLLPLSLPQLLALLEHEQGVNCVTVA